MRKRQRWKNKKARVIDLHITYRIEDASFQAGDPLSAALLRGDFLALIFSSADCPRNLRLG